MNLKVIRIKTVDQVVKYWPIFQEGRKYLNTLMRPTHQADENYYLRLVLDVIALGEDEGHLVVYGLNENDIIGYTIAFGSNSKYDFARTAVIFAAYTKRTVPGASKFGLKHVEKWAKSKGFVHLQAFTPRINGKGFALFEKRFGFQRHLVCFTKTL